MVVQDARKQDWVFGWLWQKKHGLASASRVHYSSTTGWGRATPRIALELLHEACFFPNLSGIHDCAYSNCQRHRGDFREVTIKKPGISQYSVHSQRLHPRPGHQTRSRLIEGDVTVWANTCDRDSLKSGSLAETVFVRSRTNSTVITGTSNTPRNRRLQFFCSNSNVLPAGMTARTSSEVKRDSSLIVLGLQ